MNGFRFVLQLQATVNYYSISLKILYPKLPYSHKFNVGYVGLYHYEIIAPHCVMHTFLFYLS